MSFLQILLRILPSDLAVAVVSVGKPLSSSQSWSLCLRPEKVMCLNFSSHQWQMMRAVTHNSLSVPIGSDTHTVVDVGAATHTKCWLNSDDVEWRMQTCAEPPICCQSAPECTKQLITLQTFSGVTPGPSLPGRGRREERKRSSGREEKGGKEEGSEWISAVLPAVAAYWYQLVYVQRQTFSDFGLFCSSLCTAATLSKHVRWPLLILMLINLSW